MRTAWSLPKAGNSALTRARTLRAELARLVRRVIEGKAYAQQAAALLSPYLSALPFRREAVVENGQLDARLRPDDATDPANEFLGTIAGSALDLLVHAKAEHIRKCANPLCVVVFHDKTKNHRRQWCSMEVCGNRAKAERFREKHHHQADRNSAG
jgi:predicted RNA-binding Zn ribbon-like protein